MSLGPWQIGLIVLLALVFFGRGRISEMMGDVGKGIKSFKKGLSEEEADASQRAASNAKIESKTVDAADKSATSDKTAK